MCIIVIGKKSIVPPPISVPSGPQTLINSCGCPFTVTNGIDRQSAKKITEMNNNNNFGAASTMRLPSAFYYFNNNYADQLVSGGLSRH